MKQLFRNNRLVLLAGLFNWLCVANIFASNDTFSCKTAEGVSMMFHITNEELKECEVYGTYSQSSVERNTNGSVSIPEKANGYTVKAISSYAFNQCTSIVSITISNSVVTIGEAAFSGCSNLVTIVIPGNVKNIDSQAFHNCKKLIAVVLSEGVKRIGYETFKNCRSLETIVFPSSLIEIGYGTFEDCVNLTSVSIPQSISKIEWKLFSGCSSLRNIVIPESVTTIGKEAFKGCVSLETFTIPAQVTFLDQLVFGGCSSLKSIFIGKNVTRIYQNAFNGCSGMESISVATDNPVYDSRNGCNAIIQSATNELVIGCKNTTIPDDIEAIGPNSFYECIELKSITLPSSVKSIGDNAFRFCKSLESIQLSDGVTIIGSYAFHGCSNLLELNIPSTVKEIEMFAFESCEKIESIVIPQGVDNISRGLFLWCKSLKRITLPSSLKAIEQEAFQWCYALEDIQIPEGTEIIGERTFYECTALTSISLPSTLISIGNPYSVFSGCLELKSISIAKGNPKYDSRENCNAIIETETNTLVYGCQKTKIPTSVTSIASNAFNKCYGLEEIAIPASVRSIGDYAFYECNGLIVIKSYIQQPYEISQGVFGNNPPYIWGSRSDTKKKEQVSFYDTYSTAKLLVPKGTKAKYEATPAWNQFSVIEEMEDEETGTDDLQDYLNSLEDTEDTMAGGKYIREFRNTDWQSLYLPFSINHDDWAEGFEVARFEGIDVISDGNETAHAVLSATIMESGKTRANTPYLIRAKNKDSSTLSVSYSTSNHAVQSVSYSTDDATYTFTGNYTSMNGMLSSSRYRLQGGWLNIPSSDSEVLPPYRWYLTIAREGWDTGDENDYPSDVRLYLSIGDETKYIGTAANDDEGDVPIFNLKGQRVSNASSLNSHLKKGLYIKNNKKYIIK